MSCLPTFYIEKHYSYVSEHLFGLCCSFENYAQYIINDSTLVESVIIDIGSNDGTGLNFFKTAAYKILGIDPAVEIVQQANKRALRLYVSFLS